MNSTKKQIDRTGRAQGKFNEPWSPGSTPSSPSQRLKAS